MTDNNLTLEIYTPAGLALQDNASQVSIPSEDGEIGILPEHISYTGLLGTGVLEYFSTESNQAKRLVLSGGFTNVSDNKVVILADTIDFLNDIDEDNYASERGTYLKTLEDGHCDEPNCVHAKTQIARIEAIDKLISH